MTKPISAGALRAAEKIMDSVDMPTFERGPEVFAAIIDESTGLPELLEALREIDSMLKGDLPITRQVKEIAVAAIRKAS